MLIPLVSLFLAVAAPAPAGDMSPSRRGEIAMMAADWTSYRNRASRMMAAFPAAAAREGWNQAEMIKILAEVRLLLSSVEYVQTTTADIARVAIQQSEPPSPSRLAREKAVTDVFEGRALTIYGNMLPRILDELATDKKGRSIGRRFAGPEWAVVIDFKEAGTYGREPIARAGFTRDQYAAFEKRAQDLVGLPPTRR